MYFVIKDNRDYVSTAWPTRAEAERHLLETASSAMTFDVEHPEGYPTPRHIEAVAGDPVICHACGRQVATSGDPSRYPFCKSCHYTGSAAEHLRADTMRFFTEAFPGFNVSIDHTGGGCFWLRIQRPDSRVYHILTNGEAGLPSDDAGEPVRGGWGYVGSWQASEYEDGEDDNDALYFNEDALSDPAVGLTDEQAADLIRRDLV